MDIIYISSLFPDGLIKEIQINSKGNIHYAGNTLQWNLLKGLINNPINRVFVITAPMIGSFPIFYKRPFIKSLEFVINKNSSGTSVGYTNITFLKDLIIRRKILKSLKNIYKVESILTANIIVYGMHEPYMNAVITLKKRYPETKISIIVPDLPEFYSNFSGLIWKFREFLQPNTYNLIRFFEYFVVLTDQMVERLKITNKPWVRIEGMIDPKDISVTSQKEKLVSENKIILYTGTLAERYGILDLISSFMKIEKVNYELWICGAGEAEIKIRAFEKKDKRIRFLGQIPREQVLNLQQQATVLINPRNAFGEYTKYSFPSKTLEYMLSGTPIIMYKLPGIPPEYDSHLHYIDNTIEEKIIEICEQTLEKREEWGKNAKEFLIKNKNYKVQTDKVLNMILSK